MTWQPMGAVELGPKGHEEDGLKAFPSSPPCVVWDKENERHLLIILKAADVVKGLPSAGGGWLNLGTQSYAASPEDLPLNWRPEGAFSPLPLPTSQGRHNLLSLFGGILGRTGSRLVGPIGIAQHGRQWWLFATEGYFGGWLGGSSGSALRLFYSASITEGTWTEVSLCTTLWEICFLLCVKII